MEFTVLNTQKETVAYTESTKPETNDIATTEMFSKIDIACNNKDVEYILEVLKSEDMLYVSRAIKRCTWLITDPQYAHIINPEYLHSQLFPHMISELSNKLEQNIKLKLKDVQRVEAFYNYYYYEERNPQAAFKWLPNCSRTFIEIEVQKNADKIKRPLMKRIMDAPVQKRGNQVSTIEQCEELKQNWNSTKSPKIKIVLFKKAYNLLIKEDSPVIIEEIWQLLSMFFDNLPHDESKQLVSTLINVSKVPLTVRANFYTKSFNHLKSISASERIIKPMVGYLSSVLESLDEEFALEIVEYVANNFKTDVYHYSKIISSFLLFVKDEKTQIRRYQRILVPLLERSFAMWQIKESYEMIYQLLHKLYRYVNKYVVMKDLIYPIKMFIDIQKLLEERLPTEQNYVMLTYWKLVVSRVKKFEEYAAQVTIRQKATVQPPDTPCDETVDEVYDTVLADFAKICLQYLKEDVEKYGSSVYLLFAGALYDFTEYKLLKYIMLEDNEFIESYLLVIEICHRNSFTRYYSDSDKETNTVYAEICELLQTHPSANVKLHYTQKSVIWNELL